MLRALGIAAALLVALVAAFALRTLWLAGELRSLEPHFAGTCTRVPGIVGAEDITIHPRAGVAYISAYDRRAVAAGRPGHGALRALDANAAEPRPMNLTPDADADFRPHGLSLHVGDRGRTTLMLVNHAGGRHSIEIYDARGTRLEHRRTLRDALLVSPNDLVAVDARRFYVTNDHAHTEGLWRSLEEYLRLPLSNVVMWDGETFREAAGSIRLANGINLGEEGRELYVSSVLDPSVHVYAREPGSGALTLREKIPLPGAPDNIEVAADGSLWIGAHPKLLTLVRHQKDASRRAPSQVLRAARGPGGAWGVEEIYLDDGTQLSGASVAAVHEGRLLIGAILDEGALICRLPADEPSR